ncbi:hypothetical protein PP175_13915 [Aneurinibacillus sp. Ricciae_BoGa-3]|uniref:CBO0543 family protein n=1 Tax=Aneurinibacillus sp. Ricciae_BoGa-3 TaxID=3022697 RepID=UPI00234076B8|nr:CBO0543 family protein [Aneurinibacillus sp. Ricciae_BoGa-3]WCK52536.1 hypothetical protein PP175_13915 [Aneurinibacillus sp. Ricciae_BoGa-3]
MSIVKHWKKLKWQSLHLKRFHLNNKMSSFVPAMIFSSFLGTCADFILIKNGLYSFPVRPFPMIFTVNIFFTLCFLPAATLGFLMYAQQVTPKICWLTIIAVAAVMPFVEETTEKWGWFIHSNDWKHIYSFFGYMVYLSFVWMFHRWYKHLNRSD